MILLIFKSRLSIASRDYLDILFISDIDIFKLYYIFNSISLIKLYIIIYSEILVSIIKSIIFFLTFASHQTDMILSFCSSNTLLFLLDLSTIT